MTGKDVIRRLRDARKLRDTRIMQKAIEVYATFTKDERTVLQFGMLPHDKTIQSQNELAAEFTLADGDPPDMRELTKLLAVALMDTANASPDKLVV